jgi:hypothetical protein
MAEEIEEVEQVQVGEPEEGDFYYESEDWFERNRQKLLIGGGSSTGSASRLSYLSLLNGCRIEI